MVVGVAVNRPSVIIPNELASPKSINSGECAVLGFIQINQINQIIKKIMILL
jgi:hypothetical protein